MCFVLQIVKTRVKILPLSELHIYFGHFRKVPGFTFTLHGTMINGIWYYLAQEFQYYGEKINLLLLLASLILILNVLTIFGETITQML